MEFSVAISTNFKLASIPCIIEKNTYFVLFMKHLENTDPQIYVRANATRFIRAHFPISRYSSIKMIQKFEKCRFFFVSKMNH